MKSEQLDEMAVRVQGKGFGYIAKDEIRKLILLVQSELVLDCVFTPLNAEPVKDGAELIALERNRQVACELYDEAHDDKHTDGELAKAAESYLAAVTTPDEEGDENGRPRPAWDWPWDKNWWKPSDDPVRNLVKAGALIAAEIDRLQRLKR